MESETQMKEAGYKSGFVALLGMPNAGKSTLINCLVGDKVSIVTDKPQTTRKRVYGIVNDKTFQAVLVDAPGKIGSTSGLNQFLIDELDDVMKNCDAIVALLNLDCQTPDPLENIIETAKNSGKKWIAVITKTDLKLGHRANTLRIKLDNLNIPYVEISATAEPDQAREKIFPLLKEILPDAEMPLYADDLYTTESVRDMCAEIIRENCFKQLFDELPYQLAIQIRAFEEGQTLTKIYADILVDKDTQRKIVVGHKAATVKQIGIDSRIAIEKIVGHKVYLELHVRIKKKWYSDPIALKELGYVIQAQ